MNSNKHFSSITALVLAFMVYGSGIVLAQVEGSSDSSSAEIEALDLLVELATSYVDDDKPKPSGEGQKKLPDGCVRTEGGGISCTGGPGLSKGDARKKAREKAKKACEPQDFIADGEPTCEKKKMPIGPDRWVCTYTGTCGDADANT